MSATAGGGGQGRENSRMSASSVSLTTARENAGMPLR